MASLPQDRGKRIKPSSKKRPAARGPAEPDRDSPDLVILTPEGCRRLIGIGEKALPPLMHRGLPYVAIGNSYRYPRAAVIEWIVEEAKKPKEKPPRY